MSDPSNGGPRAADGRAPEDASDDAAAETANGTMLAIEVISDAICPWCWVAKRRLETALAALGPNVEASVAWRPFELNPGMPREGLDRRVYRSRKFGSWEHSQALDAQVAAAAAPDGLDFRHDRMERTPNTVDAHRLIWLAGREGRQDAVVEALFSGYFHEGRDVGDPAVLTAIGAEAGLDRGRVAAMYASDEGSDEVRAELDWATTAGVASVPTVLVNGEVLFSGAIPPELIEAHLLGAAHRARG